MSSRRTLTLALAVVTTVLFWGSAFPGIRVALQAYSPAHLALLRFLTASAALAVVALLTRMRLPARADLPFIALLGLVGFAFYNLALNIGEQSIPSGPAALLILTSPIWTALLALAFLHERLRVWGWIGIAVSFSGACVIAMGSGLGFQLRWGALLVVSAAISMSIYNIVQKRMLRRYRPVEITSYGIWAGTILLLPFAVGLPAQIRAAPPSATLAVVYLGVCPAALAYVTWAYVLSRLPAARAASFHYGVPVVAFVIGWIWLAEVPTAIDVLGGLLALGGVVIVNTLGRARAAPSPSPEIALPVEAWPEAAK
jgi:drug/metabolite transporter (DMT)-like permease